MVSIPFTISDHVRSGKLAFPQNDRFPFSDTGVSLLYAIEEVVQQG